MSGIGVPVEVAGPRDSADTWLTTTQAARRLRVTVPKLRYLIATGRVRATKTPEGPLLVSGRSVARYERDGE